MNIFLIGLALAVFFVLPIAAEEIATDSKGRSRVVSDRELTCIGHAVVDPVAWVRHAADNDMLWAIQKKVDKWCPRMDAEKARLDNDYKDRAAREAAR
tara:strand:- start:1535 stop:1828 length:294 start_codon:yes stop_codon:yes gene_type:complete